MKSVEINLISFLRDRDRKITFLVLFHFKSSFSIESTFWLVFDVSIAEIKLFCFAKDVENTLNRGFFNP